MTEFIKSFKFNFRYIMAVLALILCFVIIMVLGFHEIPKQNETLFNVLATMFFASSITKVMRALFPDKEEVKNDKKDDLR